jgi:hypothetical protein
MPYTSNSGVRINYRVEGTGVLVTLPGLNHLEAFLHSELVVPVLSGFLAGEASG